MMRQCLRDPIGRGVICRLVVGFVGGLIMYAIVSTVMLAMGMGTNCFAVIIALITGIFKCRKQYDIVISKENRLLQLWKGA